MPELFKVLAGSHERSAEEWTTLVSGEGLFKVGTITVSPEAMISIITCIKV